MTERTVTVAEAAIALGITEKAVRRRIERNVLPSVLGPDKRRRVLASALGISPAAPTTRTTDPGLTAIDPTHTTQPAADVVLELTDRVERLARDAGALRQIEEIAGRERDELFQARARVRELELQLAERPPRRRFWQR